MEMKRGGRPEEKRSGGVECMNKSESGLVMDILSYRKENTFTSFKAEIKTQNRFPIAMTVENAREKNAAFQMMKGDSMQRIIILS